MQKNLLRRGIAILLSLTMVIGMVIPVGAVDSEVNGETVIPFSSFDKAPEVHSARPNSLATNDEVATMASVDDVVRVSIVLDAPSTLDMGYSTIGIANNYSAMAYRDNLKAEQANVTRNIESRIGNLDVVWNMTLAANIISANVAAGDIETIKSVPGVKDVVLETSYEPAVIDSNLPTDPNMATSSKMIGSSTAWAAGYTGAGSKVAIIDTGVDNKHQSFDPEAFEYAIKDMNVDILTADEVAGLASKLNIASQVSDFSKFYVNSKIPFAYNYVDKNFNTDHLSDTQSEHGSHVAGIAAANRYIKKGDEFVPALESVYVQGVAPDAQILVMKVFGSRGGAYESDYMVAIEDALILGADSVNLSLGSANPGFTSNYVYADVLDKIAKSGTVVVMSAGNSYSWPQFSNNIAGQAYGQGYGLLYGDDVSYDTAGSPGSYTNSLSVASVDNNGFTASYMTVGDNMIFYNQSYVSGASNNYNPYQKIEGFDSLAGQTLEYVFVDAYAEDGDFEGIDVDGKVVIVWRGNGVNFTDKGNRAAAAGAIAVIIADNVSGSLINMSTDGYTYTVPYVSISLEDGMILKNAGTKATSENGKDYYTGTLTVSNGIAPHYGDPANGYTMSEFSSWGIPGSLELKPEITAPGGDIYSVFGSNNDPSSGNGGPDQYENMSGTSMAAPQITGMVAVVSEYIRKNGLAEKTGLSTRALALSLLMSTAEPIIEMDEGGYYPVLRQGSGLANVGAATQAAAVITMNPDATASYADGKVKVELGDDPTKSGSYDYSFKLTNVSEHSNSYTLDTDLFTQALYYDNGIILGQVYSFLDTPTVLLNANVTYTVDGVPFAPKSGITADVDGDGDTDADDAQAILDYITGIRSENSLNLTVADVDGDTKVTSYDAHLILAGLSARIEVAPGATVNVAVHVDVNDNQLTAYKNGAYIEGYTFVTPVASSEGELDVEYSIPIIGFYGNWTDASMYDRANYNDLIAYNYYNELITFPYNSTTQALAYIDADSGDQLVNIINPLNGNIETMDHHYERAAIRSADVLDAYYLNLIRNAGAIGVVITDESGNTVYTSVGSQALGTFFYINGGSWQQPYTEFPIGDVEVGQHFEEGDRFTVTAYAIPEYYTAKYADENGEITEDEFLALTKLVGKGAAVSTTLLVDDTKPTLTKISREYEVGVEPTDDIVLHLTDNQYIAGIELWDGNGEGEMQIDWSSFTFYYVPYFIGGPSDTAVEGGETEIVIPADALATAGADTEGNVVITIYDYAGNTASYIFNTNSSTVSVVEPTAIELPANVTVITGSSQKLEVAVTPSTLTGVEFKWESDNPAIANVDDKGVVTGVSEGTTTVTASYTRTDGTELTATTAVTVITLKVTSSGMLTDADSTTKLFAWDHQTGEMSKTTVFNGIVPTNAAKTDDGMFYLMDDTGVMTLYNSDGTPTPTSGAWDVVTMPAPWSTEFSGNAGEQGLNWTYAYYLMLDDNPTEPTYYGFNLQSMNSPYFYALDVVNENWETLYQGSTVTGDRIVYAIDDSNIIYELYLYNNEGSTSALISRYPTDLNVTVAGVGDVYDVFFSLSTLTRGADGALYFSAMTGDTNEVYRLTLDEEEGIYTSVKVGDFGSDVWPGYIFDVVSNDYVGDHAIKGDSIVASVNAYDMSYEIANFVPKGMPAAAPVAPTTPETIPAPEFGVIPAPDADTIPAPAGSLNVAVEGLVDANGSKTYDVIDTEANTVTIRLLADNSSNGLVTITYDPKVLTYKDITGLIANYSVNKTADGIITFDYASASDLNGKVAEVVFTYDEAIEDDIFTDITVTTKEDKNVFDPTTETVRVEGGHDWGEPVITFSADGKTATATFTCANDGETLTVDAVVTSVITTRATCTNNGATTYTATVEFGGKTYTASTTIFDVAATGHHFSMIVDGEGHWMHCMYCGLRINMGGHTYANGICTTCGMLQPNVGDVVPETSVSTDIVDVTTPVEGADQSSDDENVNVNDNEPVEDTVTVTDNDTNPPTGIAFSVMATVMAAVATVFAKRK